MYAMRSVSMRSGSRLLMVTLSRTTSLDMAFEKAVRPAREAVESPSISFGDFTMADVMLTMRPKPRSRLPTTTAWISKMPLSMLLSTAALHVAWSHCPASPGAGPPLLVTKMSGDGQAASSAARPASVPTSPMTATGGWPDTAAISAAAACSACALRPLMTTMQPSRASAKAHAFPSPLEEAQMMALRPAMPRSIGHFLFELAHAPNRLVHACSVLTPECPELVRVEVGGSSLCLEQRLL